MTRYEITKQTDGVAIHLTEVGDGEQDLLDAFDACRQGNCSCPTDEYQKVAGMEVAESADSIAIQLKAKPGSEFDATELAACLDHTIQKANEG